MMEGSCIQPFMLRKQLSEMQNSHSIKPRYLGPFKLPPLIITANCVLGVWYSGALFSTADNAWESNCLFGSIDDVPSA